MEDAARLAEARAGRRADGRWRVRGSHETASVKGDRDHPILAAGSPEDFSSVKPTYQGTSYILTTHRSPRQRKLITGCRLSDHTFTSSCCLPLNAPNNVLRRLLQDFGSNVGQHFARLLANRRAGGGAGCWVRVGDAGLQVLVSSARSMVDTLGRVLSSAGAGLPWRRRAASMAAITFWSCSAGAGTSPAPARGAAPSPGLAAPDAAGGRGRGAGRQVRSAVELHAEQKTVGMVGVGHGQVDEDARLADVGAGFVALGGELLAHQLGKAVRAVGDDLRGPPRRAGRSAGRRNTAGPRPGARVRSMSSVP